MFTVRKVRVGDVNLKRLRHPNRPNGTVRHEEGVRLKADSHPEPHIPYGPKREEHHDWASIHINLALEDAPPPGKELTVVVADTETEPVSENVPGLFGWAARPHFLKEKDEAVDEEREGRYLLSLIHSIGGRETAIFTRNQAQELIHALLREWFGPDAVVVASVNEELGEAGVSVDGVIRREASPTEYRDGVDVHPPPDRPPPDHAPSE